MPLHDHGALVFVLPNPTGLNARFPLQPDPEEEPEPDQSNAAGRALSRGARRAQRL